MSDEMHWVRMRRLWVRQYINAWLETKNSGDKKGYIHADRLIDY